MLIAGPRRAPFLTTPEQYLYVSLEGGQPSTDSEHGAAISCDALQTFSIGKTSGELTFKGATSFGWIQVRYVVRPFADIFRE